MKQKKHVAAALAIFALLICLYPSSSAAQGLTAQLIPELTIGDDESAEPEYLFAGPRAVAADQDGYLYVLDRNEAEVRLYDEEGTYAGSIGRRGEGPGEFQDPMALTIAPDGALVVVDRMGHRITRFTERGEAFETFPFPEDAVLTTWWIGAIGPTGFLLRYRYYQDRVGSNPEEEELLHEVDDQFEPVTSFATGDAFYDLSDRVLHALPGSPSALELATCGAGCVLAAPGYYEGQLYRFRKDAGGRWHREVLRGHQPAHPSYIEMNAPDLGSGEAFQRFMAENAYTASGPRAQSGASQQRIWVRRNNLSAGVAELRDGRIAHFTTLREGDRWIHGLELFDEDGQFLGYGPIENLEPGDEQTYRAFTVKWVDEEGRLYVIDRTSDFPIIHRMRLEVEGLDN